MYLHLSIVYRRVRPIGAERSVIRDDELPVNKSSSSMKFTEVFSKRKFRFENEEWRREIQEKISKNSQFFRTSLFFFFVGFSVCPNIRDGQLNVETVRDSIDDQR